MNAMPPPDWWSSEGAAALAQGSGFTPFAIPPEVAPRNDLTDVLAAFLAATAWPGGQAHLAEAMPHAFGPPDVSALRITLANLGYRTRMDSTPPATLRPDELPVLLLPRRRPAELLFVDAAGTAMRYVAGSGAAVPAGRLATEGAPLLRLLRAPAARNPHARESWVRSVLDRFRPALPGLLLASLMLALLALAVPLFSMAVFDMLIGGRTTEPLPMLLAGLLLALLFEAQFRAARVRILARIGARIDSLMSTGVFDRLLGLPLAMTERANISAQVSRVRDFSTLREFFSGSLAMAALDVPFAVLLVGIIAVIGGPVALAPLFAALAFAALFVLGRRPMRRAVASLAVAAQERDQLATETLASMRLLRATGSIPVWARRHASLAAEAAMAGARVAMLGGTVAAVSQAIAGLAALTGIGLGVHAVLAGHMTGGALIAAMMLIWRVLGPLQMLFTIASRWEQVCASMRQADQLMALAPEREPGQVVRPAGHIRGDVALARVSLRYTAQSEPALLGVSVEVKAGQMVAVTGASGAGKTSLILTIMGLYKPSAGVVRIDGLDSRRFDPVELRRAIAYVPAVPQLVYGTIAQNLLLANPTATRAEMLHAAELTGLDRLVARLNEGFETRVKENGAATLPGSLLIRLSLTRALLRPARIVLLDEPANGLDDEGSAAVRRVIETLRHNTTLFVVTHRPSHIALADRVLRLHEGQLEELPRPQASAVTGPTAVPIRRAESQPMPKHAAR